MNNTVFGKIMQNLRKHRDIKLVTKDKRRDQLASEPNHHTAKFFSESLMATEMKNTKVKINKPIYLGMSIVDISKTLMYEFWYDYIQPKYQDRAKVCYMDTEDFVIHIITEGFYKDIANDVEKWFDTSNYDEDDKGPLPIGNNKKVGLFKDELGGRIIIEFVGRRAKIYAYLIGEDNKHKKAKGAKKCIVKRELKFKNYEDCLFNSKIILNSQQRLESDHHTAYTKKSIRLHKAVMMIRDYKHLIKLQRIRMEKTHSKYATVRC